MMTMPETTSPELRMGRMTRTLPKIGNQIQTATANRIQHATFNKNVEQKFIRIISCVKDSQPYACPGRMPQPIHFAAAKTTAVREQKLRVVLGPIR